MSKREPKSYRHPSQGEHSQNGGSSKVSFMAITENFEQALSAMKSGFRNLWLVEQVGSLKSSSTTTDIDILIFRKVERDDGGIELHPASHDDMQRITDTFKSDDPKLMPTRSSSALELGRAQIITQTETVPFQPRAEDQSVKKLTPQQELYELAMQNETHSIVVEANLAAKFLTTGKAKLNSVRAFDERGQPLSKSCVLNGVRLSNKLRQYLSDSIGKAQRMTLDANPEELGFQISDEAFFQLAVPICQDIISWAKSFKEKEW